MTLTSVPRALRWLLVAIPGAYVAFILTVNVLLWTGTIERLVSGTHRMATIELRIGHAWMLWPGTAHVRDFELDVDAYRYQLHVELPEAVAEISLLDLLGRTFHTRSIVGHDASVVLLLKMPPDRVDERRLASFPSIADFGPAIREVEPPAIPTLDEAFSIELENIDATVAMLWVDEFRFDTRDGHLTGNLRTTAGHAFKVWGAEVEIADATLGIGDDDGFADEIAAHLELDIDEFDPFGPLDQGIVSHFSTDLLVHAIVRDISFGSMYLPDAADKIALGGGEGPLDLHLIVDSGILQPDTFVRYRTDAARLYAGKLVVGTRVNLSVDVAAQADGTSISSAGMDLDAIHGGLAGTKHSGDRIVADDIELFIASSQTDLKSDDWPISDLRVRVPHLRLVDLHDLAGAIDGPRAIGGAVELSWKTSRRSDGRFAHDATLDTHRLSWIAGGTSIHGSGKVRAGARTTKDFTKTTIGKIHVEVDGLALHTKNGDSEGTWIRVAGGKMTLNHETGRVDGQLHGRIDDLRPILAHASARVALSERIPDLNLTRPLEFDIGVHVRRNSLTIDIDDLSRPTLHVTGRIRRVGKRSRFAIQLRDAHIGAHGEGGGGKPTIDLGVSDGWLASKRPWVDAVGKRP